jgi:hypothetical protein
VDSSQDEGRQRQERGGVEGRRIRLDKPIHTLLKEKEKHNPSNGPN